MLDQASLDAINSIIAADDDVLAVYGAHTHGNFYSPMPNPDQIYNEIGSVKEDIGGYALIELYEGGIVHSFRRAACGQCLEWGWYPLIVEGKVGDRAYTAIFPRTVLPDGSRGPRTGGLRISPAAAG